MIAPHDLDLEWPEAAGEYLSNALPLAHDGKGWEHNCTSSFQMGCEALVRLGHARETDWGAIPIDPPKHSAALPRWDDIGVAVLSLAKQRNKMSFLLGNGSQTPPKKGRFIVKQVDPPPEANIFTSNGLGCAHADDKTLNALSTLGLIETNTWAKRAELIFWRVQPKAWNMNISEDPRFVDALAKACETMPADIRDEMSNLTVITDEDIEASVAQSEAASLKMRARFGLKAKLGTSWTEEQARRSLASSRSNRIDWFFFRRWRILDGWLTSEQAANALDIFHDPLAMEMRRHVIQKLYPNAQIRNE